MNSYVVTIVVDCYRVIIKGIYCCATPLLEVTKSELFN